MGPAGYGSAGVNDATGDSGRWGLLLVAAGFYQCTPLKSTCLARCNPLAFLMQAWRDGSAGALVMGLHHGLFCIGAAPC